MKKIFLLSILTTAFMITSCGSSDNDGGDSNEANETLTLTPKTVQIKGDLGDYFEVIDKEYETTHDMFDVISIEIKRTDKDLPFDSKSDAVRPTGYSGAGITTLVGFGLELYDEKGNVVEKKSTGGGMGGSYSYDDIIEAIKMRPGETGIIRFAIDKDKKPVTFVMTSIIEKVTPSDDSYDSDSEWGQDDTSDDSYSSSSSSGSTDWDEVLDSYERFVDKYVAFAKKVKNGDTSVMSEYTEYMEEAQRLNEELSQARGELSASQAARLNKIAAKMARAAQ